MHDLIIRNGELIDGTRQARRRVDVAIEGDRVAAIGDLAQAEGRASIDATGKVVAPGFIDVHNHSDGWLLKTPQLVPKIRQGFTTEIIMADGISYAPVNEFTARHWMYYLRGLDGLRMDEYRGWRSLADYMQLLDGANVQNAATHIPYANIRSMICGFGDTRVNDFQMRQIQYEIQRGMDEGAVGLSTGLDYIVQCYATTDELVAACSAMAEYGGVYVSHVRYKMGLLPAIEEAIEIGRRAGVPIHISHLKVQPPLTAEDLFEFLERARREVDITYDVYPYQPGSTLLSYFLPYEVWEDGPLAASGKLADPRLRRLFLEGFESYRLDLDCLRIAWMPSKENSRHEGRTLREYIDESGQSIEDALADLMLEERFATLGVMDEGDDELVFPLLAHDLYMMGTDGIYFPDAPVHPRMYGSTGRLLGRCVRDLQLFSLEDAVYKMTGFPAERFGLKDRGVLREGSFADVVVFDPETVGDKATLADPIQYTRGIEEVIVNGTPIVCDEQPIDDTTILPGRFVRCQR